MIYLARRGWLEGETGFRNKLTELNKAGVQGPGVDYGLDFNERPYGRTALWEATWKNHETIVRLLLEKNATIDFADYQGRTPLHEAAFYGYRNLVELFLEKGHPMDSLDKFGHTPLFRAAEAGREEIVELLVERKAQINRIDQDGTTVQHIAAFNGEPQMSDWLLYRGSYNNRFHLHDAQPGSDGTEKPPPAGEVGTPAAAAETKEALSTDPASPKPKAAATEPSTIRGRDAASRAAEVKQ